MGRFINFPLQLIQECGRMGLKDQKEERERHLRLAGTFINEMSRCVRKMRTVKKAMCIREKKERK